MIYLYNYLLFNGIICDGDKNRTQRNYIFDPGFIYFGAGYAQHMKYRRCSVISYAAYVQDKKAELSEAELTYKFYIFYF